MKVTSSPTSIGNGPSSLPPFDFQPLGRVIFEPGGLARLGEIVRGLGATSALLVTDPGLEASGHPQRAQGILAESGVAVTCLLYTSPRRERRQVLPHRADDEA